jgi:hypothetical protein
MFWKKKENNEIIFSSTLKGLPEIVPIRESKYFIPEWFKKAPAFPAGRNKLTDMPTVKNCPGFIDFFKLGYVLPAWCDFHLEITEDGATPKTPGDAFSVTYHAPHQFSDYLPEHIKQKVKLAFKPACPWTVHTRKGIKLLELPLIHHYNPDFYATGGLLDTYLFHEINPVLIFTKTGEFFIKRGTPLAMLIPIQTEEFNFIVRESTDEDSHGMGKQIYAISSVFNSKMRKYEKIDNA